MVKVFESTSRAGEPGVMGPNVTPLPFTLPGDDHVYTATVPKRSVWQRAQLAARTNVPGDRKIASLIDFLRGTLADPQDGARLEDRLLDPADDLDLEDLFPVVTYLSTTWSAQATGKPLPDPAAVPPAAPESAALPEAAPPAVSAVASDVVVVAETPAGPATTEVATQADLPPVPATGA